MQNLTSLKNKKRLRLISYLGYLYAGSVITVTGVLVTPASIYFKVNAGTIGYILTLLYAGMLVATIFGGLLMSKIALKYLITCTILITILITVLLTLITSIPIFSITVIIQGFTAGIMLTIGNYIITYLYKDPDNRSKKLIFMDLFFTLSGIIIPFIAAILMRIHLQWNLIYDVLLILEIIIIILTFRCTFPEVQEEAGRDIAADAPKEKWGIAIYALMIALLFYTIGEYVFSTWFPNYLAMHLKWTTFKADLYITVFWMFMSIGLYTNQIIIKRVKLREYILFSIIMSFIFVTLAVNIPNEYVILGSLICFGFFTSVIYSAMISFGSFQLKNPSSYLSAFLMIAVSLGTMVTTMGGGMLEQFFGIYWTVNLSCAAFILCLITYLFCFFFSKVKV